MKHFYIATSIVSFAVAGTARGSTEPHNYRDPFQLLRGPGGPGACTFDVLFAPEPGKPNGERLIQFGNSSIIAGPLFLTLTNQSTGKSINLNASGPQVTSLSGGIPTTVRTLGTSLVLALPPNLAAAAGLPTVALTHGQVVSTFDAQGTLSAVTFNGTAQDVCQMLE